jgi:hypothetical protein
VASVAAADSVPELKGNWVQQLASVNFNVNHPGIRYPRFANFCRNVYNWGDRTFNSYDTTYVQGTGKNWKVFAKNYNWVQSYAYIFDLYKEEQVMLHSPVNSDFGLNLSFMAVSVGYTWNVNQWLTGNDDNRRTFNFAFTCALFSAELMHWSTSGNTRITKFGSYDNGGHRLHYHFNDITQNATIINAYYFFNHRKYSQGAAYHYSKYQRRSAGTWLLGFNYGRQNINMDFSNLPSAMLDAAPLLPRLNTFKFTDYNIMGGYAYNAVMPHNWLYNITVMPAFGYKHSSLYDDDRDARQMLSVNMQMKMSFTYNHRAFFLSGLMRLDGGFYFNKNYTMFNSMESASLLVGMRF